MSNSEQRGHSRRSYGSLEPENENWVLCFSSPGGKKKPEILTLKVVHPDSDPEQHTQEEPNKLEDHLCAHWTDELWMKQWQCVHHRELIPSVTLPSLRQTHLTWNPVQKNVGSSCVSKKLWCWLLRGSPLRPQACHLILSTLPILVFYTKVGWGRHMEHGSMWGQRAIRENQVSLSTMWGLGMNSNHSTWK